jgi:hypothetical protein
MGTDVDSACETRDDRDPMSRQHIAEVTRARTTMCCRMTGSDDPDARTIETPDVPLNEEHSRSLRIVRQLLRVLRVSENTDIE